MVLHSVVQASVENGEPDPFAGIQLRGRSCYRSLFHEPFEVREIDFGVGIGRWRGLRLALTGPSSYKSDMDWIPPPFGLPGNLVVEEN